MLLELTRILRLDWFPEPDSYHNLMIFLPRIEFAHTYLATSRIRMRTLTYDESFERAFSLAILSRSYLLT